MANYVSFYHFNKMSETMLSADENNTCWMLVGSSCSKTHNHRKFNTIDLFLFICT